MIESVLLATTRVRTFDGERSLTSASGFFFARGTATFLVTSRHVLSDPANGHAPNRIEIELHSDPGDLRRTKVVSIWLFEGGRSRWRQGSDSGGEVDIAVIPLDASALPARSAWTCFEPANLRYEFGDVRLGAQLLIIGFPLGFYDTIHHLRVARQGSIASAFGVRFQSRGQFLTDARTHRGISGAPVVLRNANGDPRMPWLLLGVHSSRLDMSTREGHLDEALGLNCAWYADMLLTLTCDSR